MKYSKNKQKIHLQWVLDIIINHPYISSRKIQTILDSEGRHLSRNYILKLLDRSWQYHVSHVEIPNPELRREIGVWIMKFESLENEYRNQFSSLLKRFKKAIKNLMGRF